MTKFNQIKLFEEKKVRAVYDDAEEKWYFSIVDVCEVLTESKDAAAYWRKLKQRLNEEGNETVTNCHALKLQAADGKMRKTDVADTEQLFRLIQSIPSPKAEPFKQWMAQVAAQRLDQMQDPELGIQQALADYKRLGYSDNWINQRLKSVEIRKDLTDEWKRHGLEEGVQFATLTDIIYHTWAGMTAHEYKKFKGLKKDGEVENVPNLLDPTIRNPKISKINKCIANLSSKLSSPDEYMIQRTNEGLYKINVDSSMIYCSDSDPTPWMQSERWRAIVSM